MASTPSNVASETEMSRGQTRVILRQRIIAGGVSDPLPSEHYFAKELGVAQSTVHRAMISFEREGLLSRDGRLRRLVTLPKTKETQRLLNRSIVVFTPYRLPVKNRGQLSHNDHGWIEGVNDGAIAAVQEGDLNTLILRPETISPDTIQQLLEERPEGVVIPDIVKFSRDKFEALINPFVAAKIPVAAFCAAFETPTVDCVKSDHENGSYQLTQYLLKQGRKRILRMVKQNTQSLLWVQERQHGYERAMHEAGIEPLPPLEMPDSDLAITSYGEERVNRLSRFCLGYLYNLVSQVDAIMTISDGDIPFVAKAIKMLGRDPANDLLLTGYDNYWSDTPERNVEPTPPVATIDKLNYESGQELVRLIMDRKEGKLPPTPVVRVITPKLITPLI